MDLDYRLSAIDYAKPQLPDTKRSKYNPFLIALRLENLPPPTKPSHLTHILTHPPQPNGLGKRQESGVSL